MRVGEESGDCQFEGDEETRTAWDGMEEYPMLLSVMFHPR